VKYQPVIPAECPLDTRFIHCYLDSGITPFSKDNCTATATVTGPATYDSGTSTTTIPIDALPVGVAAGYGYRIRRTGTGRNGLYYHDAYVQRALGGAAVGVGQYGVSGTTATTITTVSSLGRPDPLVVAAGDVVEFYAANPTQMLLRGYYATARRIVVHCGEILNVLHVTGDAQAFETYNGPGPYEFSDVAVLGPIGIPFHVGGAEMRSDAMVPRDINVERCHFNSMGHMPRTYGGFYTMKNLGEMKCGSRARWRRLVLDGTLFEDGQQYGVALNFKQQLYGRTADTNPNFADRRILTATTSHVSVQDVIMRRTAGVVSFIGSQLGNADNVSGLDMDGYVMAHHLALDNVVHMQPTSTAEIGSGGISAPFTVSGSRSPTNELKMPRGIKVTRVTSMSQQRQGTSSGSIFGTPTIGLYGGGSTTFPKMHIKDFQFTQNVVRAAVLGGSAGQVNQRLFVQNNDDLTNLDRNAGIIVGGGREMLTGTSTTLAGNYIVNSLTTNGSAFIAGAVPGNIYDANDAGQYVAGVGQFVGDPVNSPTLSDYALHPAIAATFSGGADVVRLAALTAGVAAL
jgi:hypothetical protein